jgi:regulator of RNase E activity RraA
VFTHSVTPITVAHRFAWVEFDSRIVLPGQTGPAIMVANSDWLHGSMDGLAVVPGAVAEEVIGLSEELARIEELIAVDMSNRSEQEAVMKVHPRFRHIQRFGKG